MLVTGSSGRGEGGLVTMRRPCAPIVVPLLALPAAVYADVVLTFDVASNYIVAPGAHILTAQGNLAQRTHTAIPVGDGHDGPLSVAGVSAINTYLALAADAAAGSSTLTVSGSAS